MKLVVQRVNRASVTVDGETVGSIQNGYMVLWGARIGDTKEQAKALANKLLKLRIFEDENEKINLSIKDVKGSLLVVSQFTLYADCRKGNRPSFTNAMPPSESEKLYEYFISLCKEQGVNVQKGVFGAHMEVELVNDGPVTIVLENESGTSI